MRCVFASGSDGGVLGLLVLIAAMDDAPLMMGIVMWCSDPFVWCWCAEFRSGDLMFLAVPTWCGWVEAVVRLDIGRC